MPETKAATDIFNLLQSGGLLGLFILIIVGGMAKWWVFGWVYSEMRAERDLLRNDRDRWQELALRGTDVLGRTVRVIEKAVP